MPEKISLELETRVDTISYEAISLLKEGGLRHIHIGIESMIDRDLKLYNKGVTIKQNKEALNIWLYGGACRNSIKKMFGRTL